jgi:ArsR family transcriptional regulator, virulence genes transcriptional regulator
MDKHTSPTAGVNGERLRPAMRILRALAHPLRLRIIRTIHEREGAANVGEIFGTLGVEQSVVSQHLRVLRQASLVKTRRDHKFIYYSLDYERIARTATALTILVDNGPE